MFWRRRWCQASWCRRAAARGRASIATTANDLTDNPDVAAYVDGHVAAFLGSRTTGAIAHYVIYGADEGRIAYDLSGKAIPSAVLIGVA